MPLLLLIDVAGCRSHPDVEYQFAAGRHYTASGGPPAYTLEERAVYYSHVLNVIHPTKTPVRGKAAIVLASNEALSQYARQTWPKQGSDWVSFVVNDNEQTSQFLADAIRARQIFDDVSVVRRAKPDAEPLGDAAFLVFFDRPDPAKWPKGSFLPCVVYSQVRVLKRDWPGPRDAALLVPLNRSTGQVIDWLNAVEAAARADRQ